MITSICTIGTSHSVRDVGPVQSEATQKKMLLKSGTGELTMAEYIKRETAVRAVMAAKWVDGSDGAMAIEIVASPPAADVAPVVHGLWEKELSSFWRWTPSGAVAVARATYRCGLCGRGTAVKSNYCPNCGAKMDGGDSDAKSV
jgi:hypothetical protein